jgi:hypothetical protein
MDWAKGYVADIGYTAGFFRQTTPSHLAFAALTVGRSLGRASHSRRKSRPADCAMALLNLR